MFPITRRNVAFFCATSQLEINQQVFNHVSTCTTEGVLPDLWLLPLHTPFVKASFQMETIECDIQMMGRGCSLLVFFFFFVCYSFLCRLTNMTMLIYIVAQVNYALLVMFDTLLKTLLYYCWLQNHYFIFCHVFYMLLLRIDLSIFNMIQTPNTTRKKDYYNRKNRCNNYKVIAIRCYCNDKKVVASRCNKLRRNEFIQHKNHVSINPKHRKLCSQGVNAVPKTLQAI